MKMFKTAVILFFAVLLTGCASTLKTYSGKTLSLDESGVLTCDHFLRIHAVDGNPELKISSGGGLWFRDCAVSLTPGPHTVTFQYYTGGTVSFSTGSVTRSFNVEKGNIYRIKNAFEGKLWKPYIEKLQGEELQEQRIRVKEKFAEAK